MLWPGPRISAIWSGNLFGIMSANGLVFPVVIPSERGMSDVVQKLWGFCHTLRHDGIDYGDYIEQITFLLFLKMAEEKELTLPKGCDWGKLRDKSGTALLEDYSDVLRTLGKTPGILGDIYAEAQSRFNNPVNVKRLINLIDETEWTSLGVDVKAAAYEGLLEKAASEG